MSRLHRKVHKQPISRLSPDTLIIWGNPVFHLSAVLVKSSESRKDLSNCDEFSNLPPAYTEFLQEHINELADY